jgi:hypothetical protein
MMSMVRFALFASLLAAHGPIPTLALRTQSGDLRALAKKRHLNLGSAIPVSNLKNDVDGGKYVATAAANFNLLELENDLKPPSIWAGPHEYRFSDVDFVVGEPGKTGWAQAHGLRLRGHVLVYARDDGYTLPQWLRSSGEAMSKDEATELLHSYIRTLVGRYRGKVAMWDVANEAIDDRPNGNPFNLRDSFWFRKLGPDFLVLAFKWAHDADPKAELYYNEYGIEGGGEKAKHPFGARQVVEGSGRPDHRFGPSVSHRLPNINRSRRWALSADRRDSKAWTRLHDHRTRRRDADQEPAGRRSRTRDGSNRSGRPRHAGEDVCRCVPNGSLLPELPRHQHMGFDRQVFLDPRL